MKHSIQLLVLAGLSLLGSTMKHILSTQEDSRPSYQITKITLENQMDVFMDKDSILESGSPTLRTPDFATWSFARKDSLKWKPFPN